MNQANKRNFLEKFTKFLLLVGREIVSGKRWSDEEQYKRNAWMGLVASLKNDTVQQLGVREEIKEKVERVRAWFHTPSHPLTLFLLCHLCSHRLVGGITGDTLETPPT